MDPTISTIEKSRFSENENLDFLLEFSRDKKILFSH